jgi:hypothetical protein
MTCYDARTCRKEGVALGHAYAQVSMIIRDRHPAGRIRPGAGPNPEAARSPTRRGVP